VESLPPYILLLIEEEILSEEQIEKAAKKARQKNVTAERMLILLGYLNRTQLIDAIDRTLHQGEDGQDTASGVMEMRREIQTLTGVARIARESGTGDALKQCK